MEYITPDADTLRRVKPFAELSHVERARIAAMCRGADFAAGEDVVSHDDPHGDVYFVVFGRVQVLHVSEDSKVTLFEEFGAGALLGFVSGERGPASVTIRTPSRLVWVSGADFWDLSRRYPEVLDAELAWLGRTQGRLPDSPIRRFARGSVSRRVYLELLRCAGVRPIRRVKRRTAAIADPPSTSELAQRAGTHNEAVTRLLGHLTQLGVLRREPTVLHILDVPKLVRMLPAPTGDSDAGDA